MLRTIAFVLVVVFMLAGCTLNQQLRQAGARQGSCDYESADLHEDCKKASIEKHDDYLLSVVEFDDQGWFRDRRQQEALFEQLHAIGQQRHMIIVVFVHGWKHNADFCDSNMCCFRDMLQQISELDKHYSTPQTRRQVVGVYVGWRGLSMTGGSLWENLSFWTRKETATRVALGSSRELLARLRNFQIRQNRNAPGADEDEESADEPRYEAPAQKDSPQPPRPGTRLITVGHSFGGLIVYSAIAQSLVNSGLDDRDKPATTYVKGFGDLVVLVNPAVEAARYEPVYSVAQARKEYPRRQPPVFVAVTSSDDMATRMAFPAGRTLSSVSESYSGSAKAEQSGYQYTKDEEKQADRLTIGHMDRYQTHTLRPLGDAAVRKPRNKTPPCTCPYVEDIKKITADKIKAEREARRALFCEWAAQKGRQDHWKRKYGDEVELEHQNGRPESAYWIVKTRSPIIPDHNEFYTPLFMNFLRGLYDDVLAGPDFDFRRACLASAVPSGK